MARNCRMPLGTCRRSIVTLMGGTALFLQDAGNG